MADEDDDDIFDEGEQDDTAAFLSKKLAEIDTDDAADDAAGLDADLDDEGDLRETVGAQDGAQMAADAQLKKDIGKTEPNDEGDEEAGEKSAREADEPKSPEKPKGKARADEGDSAGDGNDKGETQDGDAPDDMRAAAIDTLLDGVPDDRRAEVSRRLSEAEGVLKPFQGEAVKAQLDRHGTTPQQAVERLVYLNGFAQQHPDEYLAWVANEMGGPDKASEVLGKAAERMGYKLEPVQGEGDDDLFEDPEVARLKREVEQLRKAAKGEGPEFGPDAPERVQARTAQQELDAFVNERDETGNLVRPHFETLAPMIQQRAVQHREQTGRAVTRDDLSRFYDEALTQVQGALAPGGPAGPPQAPENPAAQGARPVAQDLKTKAAAAERARRASTPVDGSGQGAGRRPASSGSDEDLHSLIGRLVKEQSQG